MVLNGIANVFFVSEEVKNMGIMFFWVIFIPSEICYRTGVYHLKVLWGGWLAFWTCVFFGNAEISVLPYVIWQQRSNLRAIQGFVSVPGLVGFYDGITLFFFVFLCCDILCLTFTACPLESHCSPVQWCSACSVCAETGCLLGLMVFYLATLFLLLSCISSYCACMCPSLVHFYGAWRAFWALLTPTWWDGPLAIQSPLLIKDGAFQVSLEQRLVTVAQRLSLLPVTSLLKDTKLMSSWTFLGKIHVQAHYIISCTGIQLCGLLQDCKLAEGRHGTCNSSSKWEKFYNSKNRWRLWSWEMSIEFRR